MGIPRFYRWLKNRYAGIRVDMSDSEKQKPIFDNFYIDFNALIYQCIRESGCFLKNKVHPLTIQDIIQRVFDYLFALVQKVNPQKLIFIAFDGTAPRAKINQSRDRRFKSGIEDIQFFDKLLLQLKLENKEFFQANSISPGTEFLFNLCENLKAKIKETMEKDWKDLLVFYSDCCVPGEGEHKIMDFLRYSKKHKLFESGTTHCVYSPDADVILLTLSLNIENICIIKEDTTVLPSSNWTATSVYRKWNTPLFELVMINILREYFEKEFEETMQQLGGCSIQCILDDLVLLMAFVGNDFLPVEFCFVLKDDHMEALFFSYKKYLHHHQQFINQAGLIDWSNIQKLLQIARAFEANMIAEKIKNKLNKFNPHSKDNLTGNQPSKDQEDDEVEKFEIEDQKIVRGKEEYYRTRFNIQDTATDPKFRDIIEKYIEGLEFYCQYYYLGLPSWQWFYPYHYTPLLCDVDDYVRTHKVKVSFKKGQPFSPILALMFMIPEQNFQLLPSIVAQTILSEKSALKSPVDYFPHQFKLDKFETLKYNKRAIIEFLKEEDVVAIYESVKGQFNGAEMLRNEVRCAVLFVRNQKDDSLVEIDMDFNDKGAQEIKKMVCPIFQLEKSSRVKFPTLKIFGNFQLNDKGKIIPNNVSEKHEGLVFFNNFLGFISDSWKSSPDQKANIEAEYDSKGVAGKCETVYQIKRARFVRHFDTFQMISTNRQVLVPDFAVFDVPDYEYLQKKMKLVWQDLYRKQQRVVILSGEYFGWVGVIEQLKQSAASIRLSESPLRSEERIQELEENFYSTTYIAKLLDVSIQTLFCILEEVIILPAVNKKDFNERVPTALNFGLSFIQTTQGLKIVPKFIRYNLNFQHLLSTQQYQLYLEISDSALAILKRYFHQLPWVVEFLESNKDRKKEIRAKDILKNADTNNIKLYQEFLKLYELGNKGAFQTIYSKVNNNLPKFVVQKNDGPKSIIVEYFKFFSRKQSLLACPAFKSEPEYHAIGDRVILLRTLESGYVIGIDDNIFTVAVGIRQQKYRVQFTEIFNQKWDAYLSTTPGAVWNHQLSYFTPTFWKEAIS